MIYVYMIFVLFFISTLFYFLYLNIKNNFLILLKFKNNKIREMHKEIENFQISLIDNKNELNLKEEIKENTLNNILWGFYDFMIFNLKNTNIELSELNFQILNNLNKMLLYSDSKRKKKITIEEYKNIIENFNLENLIDENTEIDEIIRLIKFLLETNSIEESLKLKEEYISMK